MLLKFSDIVNKFISLSPSLAAYVSWIIIAASNSTDVFTDNGTNQAFHCGCSDAGFTQCNWQCKQCHSKHDGEVMASPLKHRLYSRVCILCMPYHWLIPLMISSYISLFNGYAIFGSGDGSVLC